MEFPIWGCPTPSTASSTPLGASAKQGRLFPRFLREGGLELRARHPVVLASAQSIATRSRQSLPSPSRSEQNYSISSPQASPPVLASPDFDGCSAASQCVWLRS